MRNLNSNTFHHIGSFLSVRDTRSLAKSFKSPLLSAGQRIADAFIKEPHLKVAAFLYHIFLISQEHWDNKINLLKQSKMSKKQTKLLGAYTAATLHKLEITLETPDVYFTMEIKNVRDMTDQVPYDHWFLEVYDNKSCGFIDLRGLPADPKKWSEKWFNDILKGLPNSNLLAKILTKYYSNLKKYKMEICKELKGTSGTEVNQKSKALLTEDAEFAVKFTATYSTPIDHDDWHQDDEGAITLLMKNGDDDTYETIKKSTIKAMFKLFNEPGNKLERYQETKSYIASETLLYILGDGEKLKIRCSNNFR